MANSLIQEFRALNPADTRSDAELTLLIGGKYPHYFDQYPDFKSDYDSLEAARVARERPTLGERTIIQPVGEFIRGGTSMVASIPESFAGLAQVTERIGAEHGFPGMSAEQAAGPLEENYIGGIIGKKIRQAGDYLSPAPVKGLEKSFWSTKLPQGVGSTAGFFLGGLAGKGLKISEVATTALLGAASGASEQYKDAIAHGASSEQAIQSWVGGAVVGTSEAAPLASMFHRLNRMSGGTFMKAVTSAATESVEEALQEGFQSAAGDMIAKKWAGYDPDRNLFKEVGDNAVVGGVSGALVSFLASAIGARIRPLAQEQATAEETTKLQRERVDKALDSLPATSYGGEKPGPKKRDSLIDLAVKESRKDLDVTDEVTIKNMEPETKATYALVKTAIKRPLTAEEQADIDDRIQQAQDKKARELEGRLRQELQALDDREAERRRVIEEREQRQIEETRQRQSRFDEIRSRVEQQARQIVATGQPSTEGEPNAIRETTDQGVLRPSGAEARPEAGQGGGGLQENGAAPQGPLIGQEPQPQPTGGENIGQRQNEEGQGQAQLLTPPTPVVAQSATTERPAAAPAPEPAPAAESKTTKSGQVARAMDNTGRPLDGKPVLPGDVFATASGRETTSYPKYSKKKTFKKDTAAASQWLIDNAVAEAKARGNDFNATQFSGEKPSKSDGSLPPASIASMHEYLFGQQPEVQKPLLKPVTAAPTEGPSTPPQTPAEAKLEAIRARREEIKRRLREKMRQTGAGVDPETAVIAAELAVNYGEEGVVRFSDFARRVKAELPDIWEKLKQYLRGAWATAADQVPAMDDVSREQARAIIDQLDRETTPDTGIRELILSNESTAKKSAAMRQIAKAGGFTVKQMQEKVEAELVKIARETYGQDAPFAERFQQLVGIYNLQPLFSARTSTSIANQAYSTPAPLAAALNYMTGSDGDVSMYEPTGGNGMLALGADLTKSQANEIDPGRVQALKNLGFESVTTYDATMYTPKASYRTVHANPPFGSVSNINYNGFGIRRLEHIISLRALEAMQVDGAAALILGANMTATQESGKGAQWVFENYVYGHYNVVDNFELDGELYGKQGAKWPVRVIVIAGRRTNPVVAELAPKTVARLTSWDQVLERAETTRNEVERVRNGLDAGESTGIPAGPATGAPIAQGPGGVSPELGGAPQAPDRGQQRPGDRGGQPPAAGGTAAGNAGVAAVGRPGKRGNAQGATAESNVGGNARPRVEGGNRIGAPGTAGAPEPGTVGGGGPDTGVVPKPPAVAGTEHQIPYQPRSQGSPFGTLIPTQIGVGVHDALDELVSRVGPLDDFVANRIGLSADQVRASLAADQIDGVALAIDQIENGGALVIADETGVGKGRQAAAIIRYAMTNGKIPVFFTKDPKLFSDMNRDLRDIGTSVNPLIFGDPQKASIVDEDNNVLVASPTVARQRKEMQSILNNGFDKSGYNAIFTTYSQVNQRNARQLFLEDLTSREDVILVLDEAHEAAGDSETSMQAAFLTGATVKRGSGPDMVEITVPGLLKAEGTSRGRGGVVYLSATYAKRPDNMPLYYRTDLSRASSSFDAVVEAMKKGGVALQQAVSEALAKAGQYIRRERDFSGINYNSAVIELNEAETDDLVEQVDSITSALKDISDFSSTVRLLAEGSTAMTGEQASMTDFDSIVHNQIAQLLLAAKADLVVERAIAAHKRGEKPLVAMMHTMESFLNHYIGDSGIKPGGEIKIGWPELLKYALSRTLRVSNLNPDGSTTISYINPDEIGMKQRYDSLVEEFDGLSLSYPISPIDYIIQKLADAGIKMGELTGRTSGITYTDYASGRGVYRRQPRADKNALVNGFNSGELDGLLLNASGSTGLSAHASVAFKDQRKRHMFIAQPALDINVFIQTLGRIKRTGMLPGSAEYTHLILPLQSEIRPAAMTKKKMRSLNANTTAEAEGAVEIKSEDILNKYGDHVVAEYLAEDNELQRLLDIEVQVSPDGTPRVTTDIARKFTGRMALLSDAEQANAYGTIFGQYQELIEQLKQTGEYDLDIVVHDDWDGVLTSDTTLQAGTNEGSIFTSSVKAQQWDVTDNRHVPTGEEMMAEFERTTGGADALDADWTAYSDDVTERMTSSVARAQEAADEARALPDDDDTKPEKMRVRERNLAHRNEAAKRWESTRDTVRKILAQAGQVVELVDDETGETWTGMLVGFRKPSTGKGLNVGASKFLFRFFVDSPGGRMTLPASKIGNGFTHIPSTQTVSDLNGKTVDSRYTRWIVTGNPIAAYNATGGRGKMVRFKARDSQVITGLLMPNNWDISKLQSDPRLQFASPSAAVHFLRNQSPWGRNQVPIENNNGVVRLQIGRGEYRLSVASAKRTGGDIYLDARIRELAGDLTKSGSRMISDPLQPDLLQPIASRVVQLTGKPFVAAGKGEALINDVATSNAATQEPPKPGGPTEPPPPETGGQPQPRPTDNRFSRVGRTPGPTTAKVRRSFGDVLGALSRDGARMAILEQRLDTVAAEYFAPIGGAYDTDRDVVTLLMNDVNNPTPENLLTAMEEAAHRFFARDPEHIQQAIVQAVGRVSDQALGLRNILEDPQISPESLLEGERLAEERFVKAVSESIDPTAARTFVRRFLDFFRQLYLRVALEFQSIASGIGVGQVNPDTAREYASLRLLNFIQGGPFRGLFSFTGRTPDEWEMAPAFETVYGMSYFPTKFSHDLQAYEWEPAVADSIEAMLMNHRNIRFAHARWTNRAGNTVSPDLLPSQAVVDVVANNTFKETLSRVFQDFQNSGRNQTSTGQPLFQSERELTDYLMARSRQNHPDDTVAAKRQAMQKIGQDIDPGLTGNQVPVHTRSLATSSAHIMVGRLAANLAKRRTETSALIEFKEKRLNRLRDRSARLLNNWRNADTMVAEMKDTITESIRSLRTGLTLTNRTGKAMGRLAEMIGVIEGRIDRPIAQQYATLINRIFKRMNGDQEFNDRFFDTIQSLAEDERFNWSTMPATEVRDTIRALASVRTAGPLLRGLGGDNSESKALTTIIASFLKNNAAAVELLKIRRKGLEEGEARDLAEAFKSLIGGGRENLRRLRTEINRFGRAQRAVAAALERYENMAEQRDRLSDDLKAAERFGTVYNAVTRTIDQDMDRLGGAIGATSNIAGPNQQFDAVPGSKFRVPRNERAAVAGDFETLQFDQSRDGKLTKEMVDAARRIEKWVDSVTPDDPRFGGSLHREMVRTADKMKEFGMFKEFRTRLTGETMKILASLSDNLRNIDLPESKAPARRLTRYQEMHTRYLPQVELLANRWVEAEHRAMVALGIERGNQGKEYFYTLFHDRPLNYIRSRTDIRDAYANPEDAEARVVQETLNILREDPVTARMLRTDGAERALINFWMASRDASAFFTEIAKKEDVKIPDDADPGYLRDVIGAPLFEVRTVPSATLKMVYSAMKDSRWSELFPAKVDLMTSYETDPNALRQHLAPLFTPFIWKNFLGEFANDPAKSVFLSPDGVIACSTDNTARAWAETQDPVSFAERLHELEGGDPMAVSRFVADTLTTMRDYFKVFTRLQPQTSDDVMGVLTDGAQSVLMSGRLMNDLPPGLIENRRYNSLVMHSLLNGIAYTAAFGHRNAAIKTEFQQMKKALENERLRYKAISDEAYRNALGRGKRAVRSEMIRLAGGEQQMKRLEQAFQATSAAENASATFDQFLNHAGGLHYNFQTGQELVSMIGVGAIQGVKTFLTDTSSTIKPVQAFGVSRQAFKMSAGALLSEIPRTAIQSVANVFGIDLKVISDEMRRMGQIGITDPDYQISFFNRLRNNMESIEALPTRPNIIQKAILNLAKGVKAGFAAPVKLGAKVTEELQGVPAFRLLGPYNTFSKVSQYSVATSMIRQYQDMVMKAVQWYDLNGGKNNAAFYDSEFKFQPEDLGYQNGVWLKDADTFRQMEEYLSHAGATINSLAVDYIRRAGPQQYRRTSEPLLTSNMFARMLTLSSTYLTQEKSILTQPEGTMRNPGTQLFLPLLSWGLRQTYSLAPTFRDANGRRAFWRGVNAMAVLTTAGIAYSLLQDWYDDDVLGKQSNVLPLTTDDKAMLAVSIVDRLARVGTLGFVGEGVNYFINQSTARPFSLDGRLLFANSMQNFISAWSDFYHQDWTGTYATVWKPLISSLGGTGWLQNIQAMNNLLGEVLPEEARLARRINASNYLRVAGRKAGMDIRVGFGSRVLSSPVRPWVTEMIMSALANDAQGFQAAHDRAVQATMKYKEMDQVEAERSVAQSYRSYHPLQSVFKSSPTEADYLRILAMLDEDGRRDVIEAVRLVDAYGAQIGASPGFRQQTAAPTQNLRANPFGRSNPFGQVRRPRIRSIFGGALR